MKFTSISNFITFISLSRLLAMPKSSANYQVLIPNQYSSPPASNSADYYYSGQYNNNPVYKSGSPSQKRWESHYRQEDVYYRQANKNNYSNNRGENYPSNAIVYPYYIWSPRPDM
jgi:hypothetical protein